LEILNNAQRRLKCVVSWEYLSFNVFTYFQHMFSASTKTTFWVDITENFTQNNAVLATKSINFILNDLFNCLHKTYMSQKNNQGLHILDNFTQICLCSLNVEIAILEINECWITKNATFFMILRNIPFPNKNILEQMY